ncbi:MAG: hypothetical protein QXE80_03495 [Pyrobaculum sp.]
MELNKLLEIASLQPQTSVDVYLRCSQFEYVTKTLTLQSVSDAMLAFEQPNHLSEFLTRLYLRVKTSVENMVLDDSDIYVSGSFAKSIINPNFRSLDFSSVKSTRMFSSGFWVPMDFEEYPIVDIVSVRTQTGFLQSPQDWIAVRPDKRFAFSAYNKFYLLFRPDINVSSVQVNYIIVKDLNVYADKIKELSPIGFSILPKAMIPAFIHVVVTNPHGIDVEEANRSLRYADKVTKESLSSLLGQQVTAFRVLVRTLSMGRRIFTGTVSKADFAPYFGNTEIVQFYLHPAYIE